MELIKIKEQNIITITNRIRELRNQRKISQRKIAKDLGIAQSTYNAYETGKAEPNITMLIKLADYYKVSVDYLIGHATPGIYEFGYFTEEQRTVCALIAKLNPPNTEKVKIYAAGIYAAQMI